MVNKIAAVRFRRIAAVVYRSSMFILFSWFCTRRFSQAAQQIARNTRVGMLPARIVTIMARTFCDTLPVSRRLQTIRSALRKVKSGGTKPGQRDSWRDKKICREIPLNNMKVKI